MAQWFRSVTSDGESGLGLVSLIVLVVASMVGIGIFTSSGFSLAVLGNPGRVLLAWIFCGLWAISGAVCYGALVARLPMSGGEYVFLSRFVHPSIGFLAGWISLFAGFTAPIALAAKGAILHCLPGASSAESMVAWLAAGLIVVASVCHLVGVRVGTRTQNGIVAAKLILLLFIILVAFLWTDASDWKGAPLAGHSGDWLPANGSDWRILVGSMSWIALSYTGFNAAVYVAGEAIHASRLVPRAMIAGTFLVLILYLLLNTIFVFAPDPNLLVDENGNGREEVAVIATEAIGGARLATTLRVAIVLSMTSSVFAMLMLGPRVYRQMALDGVMPKFIGDASFRAATLMQCVLSVIAVFLGSILQLMTYLGLTLAACSALTVASLGWVHRKLPSSEPLGWFEKLAATIYLAFSICLIIAASEQRPGEFWAMVATFGTGLLIYLATKLRIPKQDPI